jgi:hypothetical protein
VEEVADALMVRKELDQPIPSFSDPTIILPGKKGQKGYNKEDTQ